MPNELILYKGIAPFEIGTSNCFASLEVDDIWVSDNEKQKDYEVPILAIQVWVDGNGTIATLFIS
ncbi:MAG: hypothetical protein ACO1NW_07675 [Chitinophagaceae bacterium]